MSQLIQEKREISKLKKSVMQLEGKVTEVSRMGKFKPEDLESDITKWNDIIVQVYDELKTLLHDDQSVELQQYIIRYCKSNNLQHLLKELDFDEEEEDCVCV